MDLSEMYFFILMLKQNELRKWKEINPVQISDDAFCSG